MEHDSDAVIIAQSLEDPELFGVIYERYHDTIFRHIARRVGSQRAPDLTADVFVRAFQIRPRYDLNRSSCRPWLYGIATNILGDDLRRLRRQQRIDLEASSLTPLVNDPYDRSDERLMAASAGSELTRALEALRPDDRNVLLLYSVEDLTYQETAEALGIPVGTVRSRLARARQTIRDLVPNLARSEMDDTAP